MDSRYTVVDDDHSCRFLLVYYRTFILIIQYKHFDYNRNP